MLSTFAAVAPHIRFRRKDVEIDNLAFQLHYKWTFAILIVCTILVSARQYIGSHIHCITDKGVPEHVVNTFCFFTATYTITKHIDESSLVAGDIPHPGIGPETFGKDSVKRHAYYQWVPFVLFIQAILFQVPHLIWKKLEGGNLQAFCRGLKMISISKYMAKEEKINTYGKSFPSKQSVEDSVSRIKTAFVNRLRINEYWGTWLIFIEVLNVFNVILQMYVVNWFLAGQFMNLGSRVLAEDWGAMDVLDIVFPKVTKCKFHKYGPSGTIQNHDALCIMALNVVNEKIYTALWFWFWILLAVSAFMLIWRMWTMLMHKFGSPSYDAMAFSFATARHLDRRDIEIVSQRCSHSNWLFLYYLAGNLDGEIFQQMLKELATEFRGYPPEHGDNEANHQSEMEEGNGSGGSLLKQKPIDTVDSGHVIVEKKRLG